MQNCEQNNKELWQLFTLLYVASLFVPIGRSWNEAKLVLNQHSWILSQVLGLAFDDNAYCVDPRLQNKHSYGLGQFSPNTTIKGALDDFNTSDYKELGRVKVCVFKYLII